jgi:hypothetical protein
LLQHNAAANPARLLRKLALSSYPALLASKSAISKIAGNQLLQLYHMKFGSAVGVQAELTNSM